MGTDKTLEEIYDSWVTPICEYPDATELAKTKIEDESSLLWCDPLFAVFNGGPITRKVITHLPWLWPEEVCNILISTRVTFLQPGWYSSTPGWHCDDVPRAILSERLPPQPDFDNREVKSLHVMLMTGMDACQTELALGNFSPQMEDIPLDIPVFEWCHDKVEEKLRDGELTRETVAPNTYNLYDDRTWHRSVASTGWGWRYFFRMDAFFDGDGNPIPPPMGIRNKKNVNCPIYLPHNYRGW